MHGTVRIGISGWTYKPWRGVFYPEKLPQKRELEFAARTFPSIEINGTFYSMQRPQSFTRWADETPEDFVFAIKGSQYITHIQRLREVRTPLANFLASGLLRLGTKLGPILWQFPPSFKFDLALIDHFLSLLPHDTQAASALAAEHDSWMKGRAFLDPDEKRPMHHAMEIRHKSFVTEEFITLLRRHKVALVCADTVKWPRLMDVTADFVYCRLHGSEELYVSGYDSDSLDQWAQRVAAWERGHEAEGDHASAQPAQHLPHRDVYVYFDNDAKVRAPFDAQGLIERVAKLLDS